MLRLREWLQRFVRLEHVRTDAIPPSAGPLVDLLAKQADALPPSHPTHEELIARAREHAEWCRAQAGRIEKERAE